ncbi:Type I restriction modification DNA specificity domain [Mycoplasmopsis californica]|uniref:Restriction endonuclease subunit S n=1 Tax=Mycoplasmopsis equigenitalium TaxID=114883 RepID=A0ABY5J0Q0_9BACT|nr:restriction endonuclease subunit S [Mycoplasmopsis equigenitalium]UUD36830.1 restriction endonuclease subunit S [Mycoplasmopsis equigenitalium]VEU69874.1 Type I restriction modification DNA specificity domain [Mycoplasmopsis californica]
MLPNLGASIPKIRFKCFDDKWILQLLKFVASYRNGKAYENNIDSNGKYIVVNSKFVSTNGSVIKKTDEQNEPLLKGDIAFVLSDVPNGKALARTFLIERNNTFTMNQQVAGITPYEKINSYFLSLIMNRNPYFLSFDDGAKQTNLSVENVLNFETNYPSFNEQEKIGKFFFNLDKYLILNQRKCEALKNLKQGFLNKMFC